MGTLRSKRLRQKTLTFVCVCLLIGLSACQADPLGLFSPPTRTAQQPTFVPSGDPSPTSTPFFVDVPGHQLTPSSTAGTTPTAGPSPTQVPTLPPTPPPGSPTRPVLAFYYTWYTSSTWSSSTMPDLPTIQYASADDATIDRQVNWAANAGLTGFISSWWGEGDQTDTNFAKLLAHAATLEKKTKYRFASSIYFETDAPALQGMGNIISNLKYLNTKYSNDPHFFHWKGKPVFFFWDPLGNGRTLSEWASIRNQVDPNNQMIWSAEGVDTTLLNVFDGLHLFSGGYWGIVNNDMPAVDQGFRDKIDTYNNSNGTSKVWAAGIIPGYNDTKVPGRSGTYIVPRNSGQTYTISWQAAMASSPDWITITSFNEWFEGAMIEPSVTYNQQYLILTRQFTQQWERQ